MAMAMKQPQRVRVGRTIEWTTIPVWYIYAGAAAIILVLSVGGYLTYQAVFGPANIASRAIDAAESAFAKANQVYRPEDHKKTVEQAEAKLEEARTAFAASQWEIARVAAQESESLSREVIASVGAEGQAVANFKRMSGRVEVKKENSSQWILASSDTKLGPNDLVRTDGSSRAEILYNNGTKLDVEAGTLIQIMRPETAKDASVEVTGGNVVINSGRIGKNLLKARDGTDVQVAPVTVAGMRAGENETEVTVDTGEVAVTKGDDTVKLVSREVVKASPAGLGAVEQVPDRPKPPANLQIFEHTSGEASHAVVRWEPIADATKYVVEMGNDQLLSGRDVHRIEVTKSSFELEGYPDGDYFWRVTAVNAAGRRSLPSEIQAFHIGEAGKTPDARKAPTPIPSLRIQSATPFGTTLIVHGTTDPNVLLTIDGESFEVKPDGEFKAVLSLKEEGRNEVVVIARNREGGGVRKTTIIVVAQFL